jgi:putative sugar O-methyltransferase
MQSLFFRRFIKKRAVGAFSLQRKIFKKRVAQLELLYRPFEVDKNPPVWGKKHTKRINNDNFRADSVFVWQKRNYKREQIFQSFKIVQAMDKRKLLDHLQETGEYCVETFYFEGRKISRDIMDSTLELNFLSEYLSTPLERVLDIGAGYGRFASRILECNLAKEVVCIDAIPISTATSEIYLASKIKDKKAYVLGLHERDELLGKKFDLAVNIHSFPEMSLIEVDYWARQLRRLGIEWLFVVPNGSNLSLNDGTDFESVLLNHGYKVHTSRDKYSIGDCNTGLFYPAKYFLLKAFQI